MQQIDKQYSDFKIKRDENQEKLSTEFSSLNNREILLVESPTGSGKTKAAILSAIKRQKIKPTPIIITTNTNKNSKDLRAEAYRNGLSANEVVLELGKSNYINIALLAVELYKDKTLFPIDYNDLFTAGFSLDQNRDMHNFRTDILKEDFCDTFGIDEAKYNILPYLQANMHEIGKKELISIEEHLRDNKIIITNHVYFIILSRYFGNFDNRSISNETRELFLNAPTIIDEFHSLYDSAKIVLTKNFSLFQLKNALSGVLNKIEKSDSVTTQKEIAKIVSSIENIQALLKAGKDEDAEKATTLVKDFKNTLNYKRGIEAIVGKLLKIKNIKNSDELTSNIMLAKTELQELQNINFTTDKSTVSFSPKGYPSFILTNKVPTYDLKDKVWLKRESPVLAMSGTLRTDTASTQQSYSWIRERNGFFIRPIEDIRESLSKTDIDYEKKEVIIQKNIIFNESVEKMKFQKIESLFQKSSQQYHVFNNKDLRVPLTPNKQTPQEEREKLEIAKEIWLLNISATIANIIKCNSLILTMSFKEVDYIAQYLKAHRPDIQICEAINGKSMQSVITAHMRNVDEKKLSCVIGTEQYYTGLNLEGNYLQELFMVKLPFKSITGNIGKTVYKYTSYSKTQSYEFETLFKTIQGAGRGQRNFLDKVILYILDPRLLDKKPSREIIRKMLAEKGFQCELTDLLLRRSIFLDCKKETQSENIFTFFAEVFPITTIENIIKILKIDDISLADKACKKLLKLDVRAKDYSIEQIQTEVQNEKYNIWSLFVKIAVKINLKQTGNDLEKELIRNNLYGYKNIVDYSKYIFAENEKFTIEEFLTDFS